MAPGWGSCSTCPGLRVELCAFWGKSALTDLHVFLLAYTKELVTGRKFLLVVNQSYILRQFLKFYFMTSHEGMGSALDLFASCLSTRHTKNTKKALQILELGLIRREPRIISF